MFGGMPSGPGGTVSAGLMYMFCIRIVGLMVGRLCSREQRSPCRQALLAAGSSQPGLRLVLSRRGEECEARGVARTRS